MPKAAPARPSAEPSYTAPALEKGLDIIELLAAAATPLSTRAIAERLGRSKGEIFRMVFVLVERGYLIRDAETDELTLSNRLFELGIRTPRARHLIEAAAPVMERLSESTGHSAHLVVINRGETVVIATTAGAADISFTLRLGYRRPALDATSGRIIIACQDSMRRAKLISEAEAASGARVAHSRLQRELDGIRAQGHLVAESHDVVGVTDIGVPIFDKSDRAIAAIVVPYLNRHRSPPQHAMVLKALREACAKIAAKMG